MNGDNEVKTPSSGDDSDAPSNPNAPAGVPVVDVKTPSSGDEPQLESNLNEDGSVKSGASLDRLPETPSGSND